MCVYSRGCPRWLSGKEPDYQCRRRKRRGFDPWVGKIPWRNEPTPVFLPGESCGQRSLAGYSPWGHKESDATERLTVHLTSLLPQWSIEVFLEFREFKGQLGISGLDLRLPEHSRAFCCWKASSQAKAWLMSILSVLGAGEPAP